MAGEYYKEKANTVINAYKDCKELQLKIAVRTALSVTATLLWYIVWFSSAINYFSKPWATFNPKNVLMYITLAVIIIAPFILFKPHNMLNFKPFTGKITAVKTKTVRVDKISTQQKIVIKAESVTDGKRLRKELKLLPGVIDYYPVGSYIIKLRGIPYPVRFLWSENESASDQSFCPMCGAYNPKNYTRCFECRTMLWSKHIK